MKQRQPDRLSGTAHQFAEHLYCWLKTGHVRPGLDALLKMIREPFPTGTNRLLVYEFTDDGRISRNILPGDLFPTRSHSPAQCSVVADTNAAGGGAPIIIFRNNVNDLSTGFGGTHCAQPLALGFGKRNIYNRGLAVGIEIGGMRAAVPAKIDSKRAILQARRI